MKKQRLTSFCLSAALVLSLAAGTSAEAAETPVLSTGIYEISSASAPDYVLDLRTCTVDETRTDGTELQTYQSLDVNQQKFYVDMTSSRFCRIGALTSGKVLSRTDTDSEFSLGDVTLTDLIIIEPPVEETETETETETKTEVETESETVTESESESETTAVTESESETAAVTETESESETAVPDEASTDSEIASEAETASETSDTEVPSDTEDITESIVSTETEFFTETETEAVKEILTDPSQTWLLQRCGDGSFYIKSRQDFSYLTLDESTACNGATVSLQSFTGKENQRWFFNPSWISSTAFADTDLVNPYAPGGAYQNLRLIMFFGGTREVLTADTISEWMTENEDHTLPTVREAFLNYADSLAEKYNTKGVPRQFTTSGGSTITLYKGDYGWVLDTTATAEALLAGLQNTGSSYITPVWSQTAGSYTRGNDIGRSYVEVDLTNQKVWLYKAGKLLLETECVSGTYGTDRQTPGGVYSLKYKQSPAVLTGADYSTPVQYWMPFNGGIGLHDANWRASFGGDIFRSNGSHGCINLPTEAAALIYETVSKGYPVVCYN
ncbi:MAG: L,D-transpeptidase family protein [Eubacteriales bacterium]|nr:L,D-transpeptidase family protein [Eubacteriales bacterium]